MKRICGIVIVGLMLIGSPVFARSAVKSLQKMREGLFDALPTAFEAHLTGKLIEKKLKTIPTDYVTKGKQPFVKLSYNKSRGIRIIVWNVDELYADLFQQYVRFFTLGPILTTEKFDSITNRYQASYAFSNQTSILQLSIRNSENLFRLYPNKDQNSLNRVDYLAGDQILSSTVIVSQNFTKKGKIYRIPVKFLTKSGGTTERLPNLFKLEKIRILKK